MIEYVEEKIVTTKQIPNKIKCNCCGEYISKIKETEHSSFFDYVGISASWGYFTEGNFYDGEDHLSHICEKCYSDILKCFKIAPTGFGKCGVHDEDINEQEEFEKWKSDSI